MLAEQFLARVDEDERSRLGAWEPLPEQLRFVVDSARAAWAPRFVIDEDRFVAYLAERLPSDDPARSFGGLRAADLYLACGCADGHPGAIAAFEEVHGPELERIARRYAGARIVVDDLVQGLREKLLVGRDGRPGICRYSGQGFLLNWLRVTAVREFLDVVRRVKPAAETPTSFDGPIAEGFADEDHDVELSFLKATYRAAFKRAIADAIGALGAEERSVLRWSIVDGLTIDQIGALVGAHRATAARRVARARERLVAGTRRALLASLRIDVEELDSIMRLIQSQLDASLHRLLGEEPA